MNTNPKDTPRHVAIIMDGNGRWAKARGLPRIEGHRKATENIQEILNAAQELDIKYLTLYAFSVENWNRPPDEVSSLMKLLEFFLKRNLNKLIKNKVRLKVLGRMEELPENVQKELKRALEATQDFENYQLNVALNYGSRTEMIDAVKAYTEDVQSGKADNAALDWPTLSKYLYTDDIPDPDLLIRTSGEYRISNFLLMQCAYSELYFTPVYWPDFGREELIQAVEDYKNRERRFGKTGEQIRSAGPSTAAIQ